MEPLLRLSHVSKRHGGRPVLRDVNLDIVPGEVMGLIGENGVGKTTLVSILSGRYTRTDGEIFLSGEAYDPHSQSEAMSRGVGVIRQDLDVNKRLTVAQAIYRTSTRGGMPHAELRDEAQAQMAEYGFGLSVDARLGNLSPLERVMVEMARMMINNAKIVLMDEVGATFTRREIDDLHDELQRMLAKGTSAIYISHRLGEVKRICNRVAVLKDGGVFKVMETETTTPDEMARVLLTREQIQTTDRSKHVTNELALKVEGLEDDDLLSDVSLDLFRGELLGLTGPARKGGMNELAEAITGRSKATGITGQLSVGDSQSDLSQAAEQKPAGVAYFSTEEQFQHEDSETIARALMPEGDTDVSEMMHLRQIIDTIQSMNIRAVSANEEIGNLSGGERQKVLLHGWLTNAADVLILNNPTRGLDVRARQELYQRLFEHTEGGGAAILISSDPAELRGWCDRIAIMRDGRVTRVVRPDEITDDELDDAMVAPPSRAMIIDDDDDDEDEDDDEIEGFAAARFLAV